MNTKTAPLASLALVTVFVLTACGGSTPAAAPAAKATVTPSAEAPWAIVSAVWYRSATQTTESAAARSATACASGSVWSRASSRARA